jgi:hypothetical protein
MPFCSTAKLSGKDILELSGSTEVTLATAGMRGLLPRNHAIGRTEQIVDGAAEPGPAGHDEPLAASALSANRLDEKMRAALEARYPVVI